ncbi:MAG: hypothetical protein U9R38_05515 [Candidatus Margulisiibacteriota bacterium]|nr:hypothetical protein [Candidatus Margulisiibacteriota bacterium]
MRKLVLVAVSVAIFASSAFAFMPAIIGGYRDGLAVGIQGSSSIARNVALRLGVEATGGNAPLIAFIGGKFYLGAMGRMPMSLGLSGVMYSGNSSSKFGFGLSAIFDRAFGVRPMFLEVGVDVVDAARAQIQLGYKIY